LIQVLEEETLAARTSKSVALFQSTVRDLKEQASKNRMPQVIAWLSKHIKLHELINNNALAQKER
jgi:hypothetical protein